MDGARPKEGATNMLVYQITFLLRARLLGWRDATGKGGHHKIYHPLMDEKGYRKYLLRTVIESMMREFPEETKEALYEYV